MENTLPEANWLKWVRQIAAFGLLAYLASFFFLGSSQQKTLFYVLVALPNLALFADLRLLLRNHKIPVSLTLIFVAYFALSSLWSQDGHLVEGLKRALYVICLMLAVNSTMNMRRDSARLIPYFILIVGSCAACLICFMVISKGLASADHSAILSERLSLQQLVGWGDSNPINTAVYFGLVILTAWWTFPQSRSLMKFGLLLLMTVSVAVIFLSKSRGPFLAVAFTLFLISLVRRHRDDLILWAIALLTGIAAVLYFNLLPMILDRASSPNYRVEIWLHTIELIKEHLFFGQGFGQSADIPISSEGSSVIVTHAHASVLETFRVGGLVGGILFLAMVASIFSRSLAHDRERRFFVYWLIFGLICLTTNGRLPLGRPSVEWFAFWIPLFLLTRHDNA